MTVFLQGVAIGGYRGIGPTQEIGPFDRFNFFAGANNSGKSTVLDFLLLQFGTKPTRRNYQLNFEQTKQHSGRSDTQPQFSVMIETQKLLKNIEDKAFKQPLEFIQSFRHVVKALIGDEEFLWFQLNAETGRFHYFQNIPVEKATQTATDSAWQITWQLMTDNRSHGSYNQWFQQTLQLLDSELKFSPPQCHLLPAIRQVGPSGEAFEGLDGKGLIDHLQQLQNPPFNQQERKASFEAINRLVQTVLGKPDARIEIPHDKENIIVHLDNKSLPLSEFGTGIEEVILIGAYCTIFDGSIMCLEEPEIHLHPILQRQLLEYLRTETTSQYFISTHSAAFLDMPDGRVFSVSNDGETTTVAPVDTRASRRLLTDELGYRSSDIVQSNSVIWVEGPSDRLYLLNWLEQKDEGLIEGVHFSIMFYGGGLLKHLTADAEKLDEFINLKSLNQHSAILIDSDKKNAEEDINQTKTRIRDEFAENEGFAWVTKGREVENYLDPERLAEAVKSAHPQKLGTLGGMGDFDNRLVFTHAASGERATADKVKVAELMCRESLDLTVLDLEDRLKDLVDFIKKANGLDEHDA